MSKKDHRINLLTHLEINELYDIDKFTQADREIFFDLDDNERSFINSNAFKHKTKCFLVFQLGYFKASGLFHNDIVFDEYQADFDFIAQKMLGENIKLKGKLGYDSRINQKKQIATFLKFTPWKDIDKSKVLDFGHSISRHGMKPLVQ